MLKQSSIQIVLATIFCVGCMPTQAEAGPLIDWLFGRRQAPAYPVGQPYSVGMAPTGAPYSANYGTYYGANLPVIGPGGAGYPQPYPSGITAATLPPTYSSVPDFRSSSYRAPVTYYRPILTTDPNTGAQVVAMAPCTSYEYQTNRVPTLGRRSLFGSYDQPAYAPPPSALPTYTLPSGGIPLAQAAPQAYGATTLGYGSYPAAGSTVRSYGSYPTSPSGTTRYYQSPSSGGSCGSYYNPSQPVPGLVAPQAPAQPYPPTTSVPGGTYPSYPAPAQPSYNSNPQPGVYPPSSDPAANVPPSLRPIVPTPNTYGSSPYESSSYNRSGDDYSSAKPRLKSVIRQPSPSSSSEPSSEPRGGSQETYNNRPTQPLLSPIPVPDDFEPDPSWTPGLLREEDLTAANSISPQAIQLAGQSKKIHWASFEQPVREVKRPTWPSTAEATSKPEPSTGGSQMRRYSPTYESPMYGAPSSPAGNSNSVRKQASDSRGGQLELRPAAAAPSQSSQARPYTPPATYNQPPARKPASGRYDNSGWQSSVR